MQSKFEQVVKVRLYKIIFVLLFALTAICAYLYFETTNAKYEGLLVGLATGLAVALVQFGLDWNEHTEIETIKKLGVRRILPHRDDKGYYQTLLSEAREEVLVLGNTASRFLEDFAHADRSDSKTLLEALGRGVKVRILVPQPGYLPECDRLKAEATNTRMKEMATQYRDFEFRHFKHAPAHSLVKIDDECLFGPLFPHLRSKDSPTIHAYASGDLVKEYLRYFEHEWNDSKR